MTLIGRATLTLFLTLAGLPALAADVLWTPNFDGVFEALEQEPRNDPWEGLGFFVCGGGVYGVIDFDPNGDGGGAPNDGWVACMGAKVDFRLGDSKWVAGVRGTVELTDASAWREWNEVEEDESIVPYDSSLENGVNILFEGLIGRLLFDERLKLYAFAGIGKGQWDARTCERPDGEYVCSLYVNNYSGTFRGGFGADWLVKQFDSGSSLHVFGEWSYTKVFGLGGPGNGCLDVPASNHFPCPGYPGWRVGAEWKLPF